MPPWFLSLLLHMGLILVLGMTLRLAPRTTAAGERTATVGIALKQHDGDREFFTTGAESGHSAAAASNTLSREDLLRDQALGDPSDVLPSAEHVIGPGALAEGGVGDAGQATQGPHGLHGTGRLAQGGARVSVFGTQGEGYKFVYVFDRSGSMGGGRGALEAAKAELLASLKDLGPTHQFQIVFYNERPWQFNPSGQPGKLAFATPQSKQLARKFVGSITAEGSTDHEQALLMAIRLQPDVIFFLTDSGEPQLAAGQLENVVRRAAGITINAIEFGFGPQQDRDNFLVRLARQTGGQHAYVDVSRMRPVR